MRDRGNDSLGRFQNSRIGSEFRFDFAPNDFHFSHDQATIGPRSGHDRAMIGPRSGRDRATIGPRSGRDRATIGPRSGRYRAAIGPRSWSWSLVDRRPLEWQRFHTVSSSIAARSCRDRSSIEPRSWSSSTSPPRRPIDFQVKWTVRSQSRDICFDENPAIFMLPRVVR